MFLLDFVVPFHCAFCGSPSRGDEKNICTGCFEDLPWKTNPVSSAPGIFRQRIAMLRYEFPVDAALKAFKFRRKLYYAPAFTEVLFKASPMLHDEPDAVLAVPLHWRRQAWRGFNQATELAKPLARKMGLPMLRNVRRKNATEFQSGLHATARSRNLKDAFAVCRKPAARHVLIIDDVTTTGATLMQLGKTLRQSGVEQVSALTVAEAQ